MRKHIVLVLAVVALLVSCAHTETSSTADPGAFSPSPNQRQGGGMGVDKSGDETLQEMIKEVVPTFQKFSYVDQETGRTMEYELYIPSGYDGSSVYPLVMFMPDASLVGKGAEAALSQGWGGLIWATEESQSEHPCFVLVPSFTGPEAATNDAYQVSEEARVAYRLMQSVCASYAIDSDRLYCTGQSMGCMLSFYLNITYPDTFAAFIAVSGHWDPEQIATLADKHFFYISSAADSKFAAKIDAVKEDLTANGATIAEAEWSAKLDLSEQNANVEKLLSQGCNVNLIEFTPGTVAPEGTDANFGEHMYAFDHAYMLQSVRDWLFTQSK